MSLFTLTKHWQDNGCPATYVAQCSLLTYAIGLIFIAMSIARFVRLTESGNHACIIARKNAFDTKGTVGYVRNNSALEGLEEGAEFELPDGWSIEHKEDKDGVVMSTKEGEPLSFFVW